MCVCERFIRGDRSAVREKDSETNQIHSADLCYHCCVACKLTSCMHRCRNMCLTVTLSLCLGERDRSR